MGLGRGRFGVGIDWAAALELTVATHGAEPYKARLKELFPEMITPQQIGFRGWTAVRALPYLDASAKVQMRDAVKTYILAKDGNRPFLMSQAFAENAELEIVVKTDAISFPGSAKGVAALEDILVRRFGREFENVYTFCLAEPPGAGCTGARSRRAWVFQ